MMMRVEQLQFIIENTVEEKPFDFEIIEIKSILDQNGKHQHIQYSIKFKSNENQKFPNTDQADVVVNITAALLYSFTRACCLTIEICPILPEFLIHLKKLDSEEIQVSKNYIELILQYISKKSIFRQSSLLKNLFCKPTQAAQQETDLIIAQFGQRVLKAKQQLLTTNIKKMTTGNFQKLSRNIKSLLRQLVLSKQLDNDQQPSKSQADKTETITLNLEDQDEPKTSDQQNSNALNQSFTGYGHQKEDVEKIPSKEELIGAKFDLINEIVNQYLCYFNELLKDGQLRIKQINNLGQKVSNSYNKYLFNILEQQPLCQLNVLTLQQKDLEQAYVDNLNQVKFNILPGLLVVSEMSEQMEQKMTLYDQANDSLQKKLDELAGVQNKIAKVNKDKEGAKFSQLNVQMGEIIKQSVELKAEKDNILKIIENNYQLFDQLSQEYLKQAFVDFYSSNIQLCTAQIQQQTIISGSLLSNEEIVDVEKIDKVVKMCLKQK